MTDERQRLNEIAERSRVNQERDLCLKALREIREVIQKPSYTESLPLRYWRINEIVKKYLP